MYLVSRDTEGDGQIMLQQSEQFIEKEDFAKSLNERLLKRFEAASGRALVIDVNNPSILKALLANKAITEIDLLRVRRKVKEEAVGETADSRVHDIGKAGHQQYDIVVEGIVFDKTSKTTDNLKDFLKDKGFYVYFFTLYEEQSFKRKIISLLLHRYSVFLELISFPGVDLPVVYIEAQKNAEAASNKIISFKLGEKTETIDYTNFLMKLKEQFLKGAKNQHGIKDLVPGRKIIYDASDPDKDEKIPFYTVKIIDNTDQAILDQVKLSD